MPRRKAEVSESKPKTFRPALTPEAKENQLISLAVDLAEKQLREGTASSQVITHYLKLGSTKERLEKEILEEQRKLISAKTGAITEAREDRVAYEEVIAAMTMYSGRGEPDEEY